MLPGMELRAWPPLLTEVPIIDRTKGGCSHCDVTHWFVKSYLQAQDWCFRTTLFKNKLCDKDKASCKVQPTKQVKF